MRDVLRKRTPHKKYVKYQNFPTHFSICDNGSRFRGRSIALEHICYLAQLSFFVFFTQGHFSAFDFSIKVIMKSFHVGILSST